MPPARTLCAGEVAGGSESRLGMGGVAIVFPISHLLVMLPP